jgi:protein TonB
MFNYTSMNYFLPLLFLFSFQLPAQTEVMAYVDYPEPESEVKATVANRFAPALPGGQQQFTTFLTQHLAYPELAREYAIEGTVVVEVKVDEKGKATVVGLAKSLFGPLDEASLAAARELPRFLPAVEDGKPVTRTLMIPFKFSLR